MKFVSKDWYITLNKNLMGNFVLRVVYGGEEVRLSLTEEQIKALHKDIGKQL